MVNPDQRPNVINLILASNPASSSAPGIVEIFQSQDDFKIVARPETPDQLFPMMDERIASVLVVVAGFYYFPAIAEGAARTNTAMVVLVRKTSDDQLEYLRDSMKTVGARGVVLSDTASPMDLVDYIRKI